MQFSVLQWNVWYREDIRHVVKLLKQYRPDIVCLQELTMDHRRQSVKDTPKFIAGELSYHSHHKEFTIETTHHDMEVWANGIFTRFPITSHRDIWINEPAGTGGYSDEYRAYVEVTLDVGGSPVTVATTHMSYTDRFAETPQKAAEADRLLRAIGHPRDRFVFTGDLNAAPGSYTTARLSERLRHAGPDLSRPTWTTKPFSYRGFETTELIWRLDYIFATPNLTVVSAEIVDTPYSDHLPVLVKFEAKP